MMFLLEEIAVEAAMIIATLVATACLLVDAARSALRSLPLPPATRAAPAARRA